MRKCISGLLVFTLITGILFQSIGNGICHACVISSIHEDRFLELWNEIHNPENGYFSKDGIPYYSPETMIFESPDYGHEATSEIFSYYIWLEAIYGGISKDWSMFGKAWDTTEKYMIPGSQEQAGLSNYDERKPAIYSDQQPMASGYPSQPEAAVPVGVDPLHRELYQTYGTYDMYGMHWMLDVDNWYGFGSPDGGGSPTFINPSHPWNTQPVWGMIPHPARDEFTWGGTHGFVDLFTRYTAKPVKQWMYTNAPDADARAIQATYWAAQWAKTQETDISKYTAKAGKMGDYLRYAFFDTYFKKIGAQEKTGAEGTGYDSAHYLLSPYYSWGAEIGGASAWKAGSSYSNIGYQNPMTAWILSKDRQFRPRSANGAGDWEKSVERQIELYQFLQSNDGAIAGGVTNSWRGSYEKYPAGTPTFYGMAYDGRTTGDNQWVRNQIRSMQRIAEYFYVTGDKSAEALLKRWVDWIQKSIKMTDDGEFFIPETILWAGQPEPWSGEYTWNPGFHVVVDTWSADLGTAASLANTLAFYWVGLRNHGTGIHWISMEMARELAEELIERIWIRYRDTKGVSIQKPQWNYKGFFEQNVPVPSGWTGRMPNGDVIQSDARFIDIRSQYKKDFDWVKLQQAYTSDVLPTFNCHRFTEQCEVAIAMGIYHMLLNGPTPSGEVKGYIGVDFSFSPDAAPKIKSGFTLELLGTGIRTKTDENGYFSLGPVSSGTYTLIISKKNYLTRRMDISKQNGGIEVLSTQDEPIRMWVGDMGEEGTQDRAINMVDVMEIAKVYNCVTGDETYIEDTDFDKDGAINMTDIMNAVKHFNATMASYRD